MGLLCMRTICAGGGLGDGAADYVGGGSSTWCGGG